jgi:CheY-like chemotaxis protein
VVDDDEDILEAYGLLLESAGYAVATATNGQIALDVLHRGERPAVILLDLMMPVMNGWVFCEELAADPALADIPVLVFSGDHRALAHALPAGVRAMFKKPVDLGALLQAIAQCAKAS